MSPRQPPVLGADGYVRAAGGIVTRPGRGGHGEILVVHRPRYDDWTLPKGKAEPGESDEACALREVEEETRLVCRLGEEVAVSEYEDGAGRPKRVRYFAMTPPEGAEAAPQNEVDELRWLTRQRALETLTYERDAEVLERVPRRVLD
jgi:8-oxo-dGTP pyrophosphatase MutT (NUDIX family)